MLSFVIALFLAGPAAAQAGGPPIPSPTWKAVIEQKFGGLNLTNDSSDIGADAQACQNVLTDNTYLEKRPGNVLLTTILSGYAVTYANDWVAPTGNRYLVAQASGTIYETNFSGSPVVLSTITAGYNLSTVPQFSELYFADGFRNLWFWNGSSTGTVTDPSSGDLAPICTYVAAKDSRLWCANVPNES